jgi:hypothetical protein
VDIAGLITSFSTDTYAVTRTARATPVRGKLPDDPTTQTVTILASIAPATGADMRRAPEGRDSRETRVLYTTTQLYLGEQGGTYEADIVSINGADWEVEHVERWEDSATGSVGYRCVVQLT